MEDVVGILNYRDLIISIIIKGWPQVWKRRITVAQTNIPIRDKSYIAR